MQGCERVFLLAAPSPRQTRHLRLAIDAVVEANVQQMVKISTADANVGSKVPWAKANAEGDHNLRSKKIAWTILCPTGIMQNLLESAHALSKGVLPYTTGVDGESRLDRGNPRERNILPNREALSVKNIARQLSASVGYGTLLLP
jgi:uncharacterized protein YbjT (DUF2867 family)